MRWPLSLLFRGDRDAPPPGDAAAMRPVEPGTTAAPEAGVPSRPAVWRSLPPIQRSVGDAPLTARTVPFGRELAGLRSPDPILRPLAHDLAADGPAGLVSGIATPLVARGAPAAAPADHADLPPPRGAQRRARTVSDAPLPARGVDGPVPDDPSPTAAGGAGSADLPATPPRALPAVAPSATAPALAATRVGASTAPEAARAVAPATGAAAPTAAGSPVQWSAASAPPPVAPPPVAPPPVAPPPVASSRAPDAILDAAGPIPAADAHAAQPAQPRSLGESRRLGLGAPLAGRPSAQRAAAGPNLPLARAGRTPAPPTAPVPSPPPTRRAAAAEAALPVLRIASASGRPATPPEPGAARSGDEAAGMPPAAPAGADTDGGPAGPATVPVQRSVELTLVGDAGRRAAMPSSDGADAAPAGAVPREGLPLAVGTGIDGAAVAPGGSPAGDPIAGPRPDHDSAAAAAATRSLTADDVGGAAIAADGRAGRSCCAVRAARRRALAARRRSHAIGRRRPGRTIAGDGRPHHHAGRGRARTRTRARCRRTRGPAAPGGTQLRQRGARAAGRPAVGLRGRGITAEAGCAGGEGLGASRPRAVRTRRRARFGATHRLSPRRRRWLRVAPSCPRPGLECPERLRRLGRRGCRGPACGRRGRGGHPGRRLPRCRRDRGRDRGRRPGLRGDRRPRLRPHSLPLRDRAAARPRADGPPDRRVMSCPTA